MLSTLREAIPLPGLGNDAGKSDATKATPTPTPTPTNSSNNDTTPAANTSAKG